MRGPGRSPGVPGFMLAGCWFSWGSVLRAAFLGGLPPSGGPGARRRTIGCLWAGNRWGGLLGPALGASGGRVAAEPAPRHLWTSEHLTATGAARAHPHQTVALTARRQLALCAAGRCGRGLGATGQGWSRGFPRRTLVPAARLQGGSRESAARNRRPDRPAALTLSCCTRSAPFAISAQKETRPALAAPPPPRPVTGQAGWTRADDAARRAARWGGALPLPAAQRQAAGRTAHAPRPLPTARCPS